MQIIYDKIKIFDTIIISGHNHPDGDCYGAQFGLQNMLKTTFPYKKIYVTGSTNYDLSFLGQIEQIPDEFYHNALMIVVDSGNEKVISDQKFKLSKFIIRIDHHVLTQNYGHYQWVDDSFGSCSEMIYLLKDKFNLKLTFWGALAIFIGIVSDSGNFRYRGVSSQTFRIASELMTYGIDATLVEKNIKKEKLTSFAYKGYVYQNIVTVKNFVYVYVSQKTLKKLAINFREALMAIDLLSNLENYPFFAVFVEKPNQEIKVRISSSGFQIYDIVKKYNAKGHLQVCSLCLPSYNSIPQFIDDLQKEIALYLSKKKSF